MNSCICYWCCSVNLNGIKTLLANGWSAFPIKGNLAFSDCAKSLPKYPPDGNILCNWVFDNCILANELLAKTFRSFEACAFS